jgi:hypothetical protein
LVKEGEQLVIEGVAARDTQQQVVAKGKCNDHVNIPRRWRKFFNRKIQLSIVRKDNVFGKYVLVIEGVEE